MNEKTKDTTQINVRLPQAVVEAIDKAVQESPIEFQNRTDFVKRAIEAELRRRGMIKQYK